VSLTGSVDNLNSKLSASQTTRNTVGVDAVENNISVEQKVIVRPELSTTDQAIHERIRAAIIRDPYTEIDEVSISMDNGIATVEGTVQSTFEKDQVAKIASNTVGVLMVDNQITIDSSQPD
jgi:osmotically-inducible protein OsmY